MDMAYPEIQIFHAVKAYVEMQMSFWWIPLLENGRLKLRNSQRVNYVKVSNSIRAGNVLRKILVTKAGDYPGQKK